MEPAGRLVMRSGYVRDFSAETPTSLFQRGVGRPNGARYSSGSGAQYHRHHRRAKPQGIARRVAKREPVAWRGVEVAGGLGVGSEVETREYARLKREATSPL
jgi:hypothetical protein